MTAFSSDILGGKDSDGHGLSKKSGQPGGEVTLTRGVRRPGFLSGLVMDL